MIGKLIVYDLIQMYLSVADDYYQVEMVSFHDEDYLDLWWDVSATVLVLVPYGS